MALQTVPTPSQFTEPAEQSASCYRFYPLRAAGRIADRHEAYFADDATAIAAAQQMIEDFPRLEIWCGTRKVADLAREDLVRGRRPD